MPAFPVSELLKNRHLLPKKDAKSGIWNFFGFQTDPEDESKLLNSSKVMCALCKTLLSYSGNTSSLRNHLKAKHPREFCDFQGTTTGGTTPSKRPSTPQSDVGAGPSTLAGQKTPPTSQSTIDSVFKKAGQYAATSSQAKQLTKAVAYHLARDMKPIYTVKELGFVEMLQKFDNRYVLPSRKTFSTSLIPAMYKELRATTVGPFTASSKAYALTTDLWTARNMAQFLGVTFHAIDDDWVLKTYTIENIECPPPHTADCIGSSLKSALDEWNLTESRLSAITTDNASNITKAVRDLRWGHIPCFGHCLNLVVRAGLDTRQVHTALARCSKLVELVHRSANANYKLAEKQKMFDLPRNKLIQDVKARWNSTLDMLARIVEQQRPICAMLIELERQELMPSADEFKTIEQLVALLKPMKEMTEFFSGSYVTISGLFPCLYRLEKGLLAAEDDTQAVVFVKRAMAKKLIDIYHNRYVEETLQLCSFLDPRFKTLPFLEDCTAVAKIHDLVSQTLTKMADESLHRHSPAQEEEEAGGPLPKTSKIISIFGDMYSGTPRLATPNNPEDMAKDELTRYIREPSLTLEDNPLSWWKVNEHRFKLLGKAAREYLCIPATSVPSERLFSTAGNIGSAKRACLKPSNVRYLTFLHDNLK